MIAIGNNSGWRLLTPVFDLVLTVVMISLATGAMQYLDQQSHAKPPLADDVLEQWRRSIQGLLERYQSLLREIQQLPSLDQLPHVDLKALEAARQRIKQELESLRQEIARIVEALQKLREQAGQAAEDYNRLMEELTRVRREIERLEGDLRSAKQVQAHLEQLRKQLEELLRRVREAQKQHQDLLEKIAAEKAKNVKPAITIKVHPRFQPSPDQKMKLIVISRSTVTPVCEPYYRPVYLEMLGLREPIGFDFVRPGPDVSKALRQDSDFMAWLSKIDPKKEYVFMLVDSTSFDTFRAVRAELRRREIASGWEPHEPGNAHFRFGGSAQGGGIHPGIQ